MRAMNGEEMEKLVLERNKKFEKMLNEIEDSVIHEDQWECPYEGCGCLNLHEKELVYHVPTDECYSMSRVNLSHAITIEYGKKIIGCRNREFCLNFVIWCEECYREHERVIYFHKGGIYHQIRKTNRVLDRGEKDEN